MLLRAETMTNQSSTYHLVFCFKWYNVLQVVSCPMCLVYIFFFVKICERKACH